MKKRTIIVVALAIVLALSFTTIAMAKYAGYAYNTPFPPHGTTPTEDNDFPGYLSWSGALQLNAANVNGKAHGGYTAATVKCAVCHSTHRAWSATASSGTVNSVPDGAAGSNGENMLLTVGGTCANCHGNDGAGGSSRQIEWIAGNPTTVGPHQSMNCTNQCHEGGIHGGNSSEFHGNNIYMLGSGKVHYQGTPDGNGVAADYGKDALLTEAFANGNTLTGTAQAWFVSGSTAPADAGSKPGGLSNGQFAQAKGTATGYTCAQGGCHDASQFAVNTWGYSEMRKGDPDEATTAGNPMGSMAFTGHRTSPGFGSGEHVNTQCGPCHPGNPAGGYRTQLTTDTAYAADARQYGCDQCHDMVGKATNTTAWPHANRAITVLAWDTTGAVSDVPNQASNNLWMYAGTIAGASTGHPDYDFGSFDKSFTVMNNNASFQGTDPTGTPGKINDGACLKCHVAVDAESIALNPGGAAGAAPHHAFGNTTAMPTSANNTAFIYLWK